MTCILPSVVLGFLLLLNKALGWYYSSPHWAYGDRGDMKRLVVVAQPHERVCSGIEERKVLNMRQRWMDCVLHAHHIFLTAAEIVFS